MSDVQITPTAAQLMRKMLAALAIGGLAIAFIVAGQASADTNKGMGGAKGCLIENDGRYETVPVGSKIGLFTCGSDGEWHFGWLITAISAPPHKTLAPVGANPVRHGAMQVKASR